MKELIINIEGFDGSGKETQSKLLFDALNKVCPKVEKISFPQYQTKSGSIVRDYLTGGFRKSENISNFDYATQVSMLYAMDRMQALFNKCDGGMSLYEKIVSGTVVIFDRYTYSNLFHQATHILDAPEEEIDNIALEFFNRVANIEFNQCRLPEPDITIFLKVPVSTAMDNINVRYKGRSEHDIHENNEHLQKVFDVKKIFDRVYEPSHEFVTIDCTTLHGQMRSPSDIHLDIMRWVSRFL